MTTIQERILAKVEKAESGCWVWTGSRNEKGYPYVYLDGVNKRAHRVAYTAWVGEIPSGLTLDHTCHTADSVCLGGRSCAHRRCVNPDHLEPVTSHVNTLRGLARRGFTPTERREPPTGIRGMGQYNAAKTHCAQGHPFDSENTKLTTDGKRQCRTCARHWKAEYKRRQKTQVAA